MKKLILAIMLFIPLICFSAAARPVVDAPSEVPFSVEKGHLIVQAKIKGDVPVDFIISTGRKHSTVDMGLLEKYKLPRYYAGVPPVTGRNDRIYFFSTVPDVRMGDIKASLSMRLGSTSEASQRVGREIFGILGADFFKGRTVQFDFQSKLIRSFKDKKDVDTGGSILRMVATDDPFENITVPVVENVTFDGKKAKILFDTGSVTVLAFSSSAAKRLGVTAPAEKGNPRTDKISSIRLGEYELTDVPVVISAKGTSLDTELSEHGAVAGLGILQNFLVTFDFRGKAVILKHL